jgi:hypothetical protein
MNALESQFQLFNPFPVQNHDTEQDVDPTLTMGDQFAQPVDGTIENLIDLTVVCTDETRFKRVSNAIQDDQTLFTVGNNRGPPLSATKTVFVSQVPAYPTTSRGGMAYIVPITRLENGEIPNKTEVLRQATQVRAPLKHILHTFEPCFSSSTPNTQPPRTAQLSLPSLEAQPADGDMNAAALSDVNT